MKRTRDDTTGGESPYATQFELMHGLTRERCEAYTKMAYAAHARLLSSNSQNANGVDVSVLFNSLALPWTPGPEQVSATLWRREGGAGAVSQQQPEGALASAPGPSFVRTVQLVANDGTTIIFANGGGSTSVRVPKSVGDHVFPGDVLLVTQTPAGSAEEDEGGGSTAAVRLCTIDTAVFEDADAWQDAASSNVTAALRWVSALCALPPGLPQLTFIEATRLGGSSDAPAEDGWTRVLQLPLLLQVSRALRAALSGGAVERLERAILSLLSTLLSVFKHSQSIMNLPEMHRSLLYTLLASPLFMEGLSDVLARGAEVLGSTLWESATQCLALGVELAVTYVCEPVAERDIVSGPVDAAVGEGAKSALGSFETVLHRLSGVWLGYATKVQEMRRHGQHEVPDSLYREQRVHDMLEGLAAEHTFRRVARWLQHRETVGQDAVGSPSAGSGSGGGGGGAAEVSASTLTPLDRIQQPPTLNHLEALAESNSKNANGANEDRSGSGGGGGGGSILRAGVVEEQLAVMNRTYTPYLGRDAVRFVEAAAVAAHSELYGPAARAVCHVLATYEKAKEEEESIREEAYAPPEEQEEAEKQRATVREAVAAEVANQRIRVLSIAQCGVRPGGFESYSFADVRHIAEYGLPVQLTVSLPTASSMGGEEDDDGSAHSAAVSALQQRIAQKRGGSCFCFLLVRFLGKAAVFPVIATDAVDKAGDGGVCVVAYVMRGADVLPQFVQTSAAIAESGTPDAWLLSGDDACDTAAAGVGKGDGRGGSGLPNSRHGPRRRHGRGANAAAAAAAAGGAVSEALAAEAKPRLLPEGTPALSYIDLLSRLNKMRVELKEELKTGVEKGSGGEMGGGHGLSTSTSLSLWMRYFAKGVAPAQTNHLGSLSPSATGIVTGTGALGKEVAGALLREATDAAGSLTPAQIEALYTLSSGSLAQSTAGTSSPHPRYLANLRIVEGSVGSGKTSMLYAAGVVKGKILAAARKEHQSSVNPKLREASARVKKCQAGVSAASSLAELIPEGSSTNVLEGMAGAVENHLGEFSRLSRGVHYCSTPLLVRCARLGGTDDRTGGMPAATRRLLHQHQPEGAVSSPLGSITELLEASLARSRNAPVALRLASVLEDLRSRGEAWSSFQQSGAALTSLDASLLPLVLSAREVAETCTSASSKHWTSSTPSPSWSSYLATQLWKAVSHRRDADADGDGDEEDEEEEREEREGETAAVSSYSPVVFPTADAKGGGADGDTSSGTLPLWAPQMQLPSGRLEVNPVEMPANIHLTKLSADQAAAWHAVFVQKQKEVMPVLVHQLHSTIRRVFKLFYDVVLAVAATAQVSRFDLITCSDIELMHSLSLPFLWRWCPPHLLVDDFAGMQDGLLLVLSPANSLTISLSAEVPLYVERRLYRGPMSILRALRKDLQRTAALATTSLNEPMRCPKAEVSAALGQMCIGGDSAPFSGLLQPALDGADADTADDDGGRDANEAASATPCFPGFSSFSPLELWTHAVPVTAATMADQEAALFVCDAIHKYSKRPARQLAGATAAAKTGESNERRVVQVCFPFEGESRQFAERLRERDGDVGVASASSVLCSFSATSFPFAGVHRQDGAEAVGSSLDGPSTVVEEDQECDIAVLCLSALVPIQANLHGLAPEKAVAGQPVNEGRAALWRSLLSATAASLSGSGASNGSRSSANASVPNPSASTSVFLERLQWWLWRTMSRAREGVLVVCSKEFALHVPMFQHMEKYVGQLRRLLAPMKILSYWLPRSAACATLAMNCPDHYRCRRLVAIAYTEESATGVAVRTGCEVVIRGAASCDSLCLKAFQHCVTRSHACLHGCHLQITPAEANGGRDDTHDHCPYPCGRTLACGHVCNKDCGSPCDPCTFVGLTELECGQWVVSGTNTADKSITYELVRHFQESRCGAPVRPCEVLVSARCPRCGTKSLVPCFQLSAHESRELQAQKDEHRRHQQQHGDKNGDKQGRLAATSNETAEDDRTGGGAAAVVPDSATATAAPANVSFILSDGECPGCVAVYNRVAAKFGFDAVAEPTVVQRLCAEAPSQALLDGDKEAEGAEEGEEDLCAMRERSILPRHQLPIEAQNELRRAFAVAGKRSELLLMKEALEVSNGSAAAKSDYVTQKHQYDIHKAMQQRQIQERQDDIKSQMTSWAQRLRSEFTKQSELTANLEAMVPSLLSEAQEEVNRQRRYGF